MITVEAITLAPHTESDPATGEVVASYNRLVGSGIFNDPNDLSLCISSAGLICLLNFVLIRNPFLRGLWLLPLPLLGHALAETHSRGGCWAWRSGWSRSCTPGSGPPACSPSRP